MATNSSSYQFLNGTGSNRDALAERVKELNCLFETTKELWVKPHALEAALTRIPEIVRAGLQFPEIAEVEIEVYDQFYVTDCLETGAVSDQFTEDILYNTQSVGRITIRYRQKPGVEIAQFMEEERALVQELAVRIGARIRLQNTTEALERSRERYRQTVDLQPDLIFRLETTSGTLTFANRAFASFLGFSFEEILGRPLNDLLPDIEWPRALMSASGVQESTPNPPRLSQMRRKDGKIRHIGWQMVRVPSDRAYLNELQFVGRDLTSKVLADLALKESYRREQARLKEMRKLDQISISRALATGFAHQLSQPLSVIGTLVGHCRLLMEAQTFDRAKVLSYLERATSQVQIAASLTRDFAANSIRHHRKAASFGLNDVIVDVLQHLKASGDLNQITLSLSVDPEIVLPNADRKEVEQLLIVLIGNAGDAARDRHDDVGGHIAIDCTIDGGNIRLSVSDNGSGIDLENIETLCKPFVSNKSHTLGMGLAIAKMIVESWGESLRFAHRSGGGTVVTAVIPINN